MRLSFIAAIAAAVACGIAVGPAHATYPGDVGRLAFAINVGGNIDIYSVLRNGHDLRPLTSASSFDACAAYSPNGRTIAFCSDRSGAFEIWAMDANGHDQHQVTHLNAFATSRTSRWTGRGSRSTPGA
jgi:Tol biopolymer transport system component